jgi:endo-1,4-beta-xylanase
MQTRLRISVRSVAVALLAVACGAAAAHAPVSLKQAFKGDFVVGAAMDEAEITGQDQRDDTLLAEQFNSISPENVLKWERIHPQPGQYNFDLADKYVAFGQKHHMFIVGHNLVWHAQVPDWVFHDDKGNLLDRDALLARMKDHIFTVVGRYKGKIQSWDVVNEAINDSDGTLRQSLWYKIIGPDYIEKAFQFAHEADPQAQLFYNDYSLENEPKRSGAIALVKKLQADGIPITGIGIQGHDNLDWPSAEQEDATISAFAVLGIKVAITELDIDVLPSTRHQPTADVSLKIEQNAALNPYAKGLPDSVQQQLATRYADLFSVYFKHRDAVERVTFWGVTDAGSWLNDWPVKGRTSYPLLFDRNGQPKPAYDAVLRVASETKNH